MNLELSQTFFFDAAHTLARQYEAEGSARVHGHTYWCRVSVCGVRDSSGMVVDLAVLRDALATVRAMLDHRMLDDVPGLGPATLENLCMFIASRVPVLGVSKVEVWREAGGDRCVLTC